MTGYETMDGKVKQLYKKAAVTMKNYGNIKIILLNGRETYCMRTEEKSSLNEQI